jgi:hypothetical protein
MSTKSTRSGQPVKRSASSVKKARGAPPGRSRPTAASPKKPSAGLIKPQILAGPKLFDEADAESSEFTGTLFIANGQSSLNGILLLLAGVSDFASAVAAAAQALQNQGFQSGQTIIVTGRSAVVHLTEHPISVIVMTGARAGS